MASVDGLPSVAPPLPLFALSTVSSAPKLFCTFDDHQTLMDIWTCQKADSEHFSGKSLRLAY